jgi:hypothetical protein
VRSREEYYKKNRKRGREIEIKYVLNKRRIKEENM